MNHPRVPPIRPVADWLDDVRRRQLIITVTGQVIHVRGRAANDDDHRHVRQHRHALITAAAGTHPAWWQQVLGRQPIDPNVELPGPYLDPACARCGEPAAHLDAQLLAWCGEHLLEEIRP